MFRLQVHFHANQTHFHLNGFALRLVLKQRHKGTRKYSLFYDGMLWLCGVAVSGTFCPKKKKNVLITARVASAFRGIITLSHFLNCCEKHFNHPVTKCLLKQMNKGGKFLKKLWCCVGGEYYKIIWFYQLS